MIVRPPPLVCDSTDHARPNAPRTPQTCTCTTPFETDVAGPPSRTDTYVAIKILAQRPRAPDQPHDPEVATYRAIAAAIAASSTSSASAAGTPTSASFPAAANASHQLRTQLATFNIAAGSKRAPHTALVHEPLWWDAGAVRVAAAPSANPAAFVRGVLRAVLTALAFLHGECGLIHTGLFPPFCTQFRPFHLGSGHC